MEGAALDVLLSYILSPDNVLRVAAERELEQRSDTVSGFCAAIAQYCEHVVGDDTQRALALVALSVLKRTLLKSTHCQEVQQVVAVFLSRLGDVAVVPGVTIATLRQWTSVVTTGVRRLAVLRASLAAASEHDSTAAATACLDATVNLVVSQALGTFARFAEADATELRVVYSHVFLLQTFFEEPVAEVMHEWCAEMVASSVSPLFEMLCLSAAAAAAATQGGAPVAALTECRMRYVLHALVAEALTVMYEWQFAFSRRSTFPADVKHAFVGAYIPLLRYILVPCAQWASATATSTSAGNDFTQLPSALSRAAPLLAAALGTQQLIAKVLQYGGWYKRCATPELLQGLLSSLEADVGINEVAMRMEDDDAIAGGFATVGPSGTRADGWVALGGERASADMTAEAAVLVRRHVTQRWMLFRDVAFLPFLKRGLVDIVGDQCGRRYYQLLLSYAVLWPSEAASLLEDPNAFLRGEEERDDGVRWTARETVVQLYTDSITALGPLFLHATLEDLSERLFAVKEDAAAAQGESLLQVALQREAGLLMMEVVLRQCPKQLRECGAADFTPLAGHIWRHDVAGSTAHYASTSRALMLLVAIVHFSYLSVSRGDVAGGPSSSSLDDFLATAVTESAAVLAAFTESAEISTASSSPSSSCTLLVAVALCRFLQCTLPRWPPAVLEQHFSSLQGSLLALLSPQAGLTEEALYSVVEQLASFLRAAQHAVRRRDLKTAGTPSLVSEHLPGVVMSCWRRHVSDPSFADVVLPLLRRVVRDRCGTGSSPALSQLLQELSWVNNVLCGYADSMAEVCAVPYFLRLLRSVFAHASDDVANEAATLMLDSLCQLLLCTDESAILVASSSCLAALLRRCPAAQSVQVHVVAASVEAALTGAGSCDAGAGESSTEANAELIAHAPRAVYPLSAVIVAIVLRTLHDTRGEASLLEMGQTLVTIMQHSSTFSEADLLRVIHTTVHRLGVTRTDTVKEQLLAPLATLLQLHPVPLLRTLVQGGLLAETMGHWLPRLEHFTKVSVTYASCEGLLGLLHLLSQPSAASLTAEESQQVAHQAVLCRWKLPEDVAGNVSSLGSNALRVKRTTGKKKGISSTRHKALTSALTGGAAIETSLPLYAAILVSVGRGLLTLLDAPLTVLRRASQPDSVGEAVGDLSSSSSSDDDADDEDGGRRLFQESSDEADEESWEEDADDLDEDDESGSATALDNFPEPSQGAPSYTLREREHLLAAIGSQMLPLMQKYGSEVSPYFTPTETQLLMSFFAAAVSS